MHIFCVAKHKNANATSIKYDSFPESTLACYREGVGHAMYKVEKCPCEENKYKKFTETKVKNSIDSSGDATGLTDSDLESTTSQNLVLFSNKTS